MFFVLIEYPVILKNTTKRIHMTLFDKNFDRIESSSDFGLISSFIFCTQQEDPCRHGCTFRMTNIFLHQNFQSSCISYISLHFLSQTLFVSASNGEESGWKNTRPCSRLGTLGSRALEAQQWDASLQPFMDVRAPRGPGYCCYCSIYTDFSSWDCSSIVRLPKNEKIDQNSGNS